MSEPGARRTDDKPHRSDVSTTEDELKIEKLLKVYGRRLGLRLVAGEQGVGRTINSSDVHRPGLTLTGFVEVFTYSFVQILGNQEMEYLRSLDPEHRCEALEIIYQFEMPCIIVTGSGRLLPELRRMADKYRIPLLRSEFDTTRFTHLLHFYLDDVFAPYVTIHGTLVDVHGVGLLVTGRSAIGKSEVGLDLVERGHRLVADDTVILTRQSHGLLMGRPPPALQDHIEIRGIGIVDVKRLFGIGGTRKQKRVEVVVTLVDWDRDFAYDRVGLEDRVKTILGVEIQEITVPIFPGKNITVIAETIAFNYLLRIDGYHAAQEFNRRLLRRMRPPAG
ncbi:MAG TPA: HPr(Ser) kinase/phosphatase [Candidatus Latescibacteria bacterium]|jgi:HPr kinase/phosphorylase|nr:HPr(Ser) kinase/phosphatase [Gemmatimonadaceae bacterium]MDP7631371.1 HPr(Ser) kinase/phosphatase [Candidatus Latescibacterota bacterium]HJP31831.1 HPr(Ser) kinase/phosphatase [Candidatus Latescibacterota bacterium]